MIGKPRLEPWCLPCNAMSLCEIRPPKLLGTGYFLGKFIHWSSNCPPDRVQMPLTCTEGLFSVSLKTHLLLFPHLHLLSLWGHVGLLSKGPPFTQVFLGYPGINKTVALDSGSPESNGGFTISLTCDPGPVSKSCLSFLICKRNNNSNARLRWTTWRLNEWTSIKSRIVPSTW